MHWSQSGGPYYEVELGRYDGRVSTKASVVLPHANFTLDQLNAFFSGLGFSQSEMIALSGKRPAAAHSSDSVITSIDHLSSTPLAIHVASLT